MVIVEFSGIGVTKIDEELIEGSVAINGSVVGATDDDDGTAVVESLCSSPLSPSNALLNAYPPTAPPNAPVKINK